jgi:membrane protein YdbS with pleckstrin-like domain
MTGDDYHALDPRVVTLWRLSYLIGFGILLLICLPLVVTAFFFRNVWGYVSLAVWVVLFAISAWLTHWRPPRLYRAWSYRIDGRVLETRSGLLIRVVRLLPLNRLQHVDLSRGPFERMFGLASLVLYTAGTSIASITIPGLEASEAVRLRDQLITIGGDDAV